MGTTERLGCDAERGSDPISHLPSFRAFPLSSGDATAWTQP